VRDSALQILVDQESQHAGGGQSHRAIEDDDFLLGLEVLSLIGGDLVYVNELFTGHGSFFQRFD